MLGLFTSHPFDDPVLGRLVRSRRLWRGSILLAGTAIPLSLAGTRRAPDPDAIAAARALPATLAANREAVTRALVDYLEACESAVADRVIAQASDVWRFVEIESASVTWFGDTLVAEVALRTSWDDEHTQGARFAGGRFVEFNASIAPA